MRNARVGRWLFAMVSFFASTVAGVGIGNASGTTGGTFTAETARTATAPPSRSVPGVATSYRSCVLTIRGTVRYRGACTKTALGTDGSFELRSTKSSLAMVMTLTMIKSDVAGLAWNGNGGTEPDTAAGIVERGKRCWSGTKSSICLRR